MEESPKIVLFDGYCNLCHWAVQFILPRDRRKRFRFAALQSDAGRALAEQCGEISSAGKGGEGDSVVLMDQNVCYDRSTAILRILRGVGGVWACCYLFILIPRPIRDFVYSFIARRRRRWFGTRNVCPLPPPDAADRFL